MLAFILRRLLLMIPTTLGVALVIFGIYHAAPGDPATVMMGMGSGGNMQQGSDTGARVDAFRREFGLDRSLPVQFLNYIGPFNLLRDGHPWFSSPYTERKVERVEVAGVGEVVTGRTLPIAYLPSTSEDDRAAIDAIVERLDGGLSRDEAEVAAMAQEPFTAADRAAGDLAAYGDAALPALLTLLDRLESTVGADVSERVARVDRTLAALTGHVPAVSRDTEDDAARRLLIEHWFGWYYTEGGGDRVQNSGAKKFGGLLVLDLGKEMQTKESVVEEIVDRLLVTVPLALISTLLSYLIALPLGIFSVRRQGTRVDAGMTITLFVLYSIPTFWAGLMLILLFGKTGLDWLPVLGLHDKDAATFGPLMYAWDTVLHSILPVVTLTYVSLAYLSRQMRAGMLDVIRQDYIRTARAKGLSENKVIYKHALRNSMIPVITILASILPILIGGSIIVESVFDIRGMGKYAFEGLLRRDFYIIMATTIFVGVMTQIGILLSDITYSLVDPRIRQN